MRGARRSIATIDPGRSGNIQKTALRVSAAPFFNLKGSVQTFAPVSPEAAVLCPATVRIASAMAAGG